MRRREVVFAPEAEDDLLSIYDWVAGRAGTDIAIGFLGRIEAYCLAFDLVSERGLLRNDIRDGLRVIGFERRLTIAFTVEDDRVVILRLFYGGQDWEEQLQSIRDVPSA